MTSVRYISIVQVENVTSLRKNIYRVIDRVIETGTPITVHRKGQFVKISAVGKINKLSRLKPHRAIVGNPDEVISFHPYTWEEPKKL